jgi:ParB-like chromosome segregation protein Spo0J
MRSENAKFKVVPELKACVFRPSPEEKEALARSIKYDGQREPIRVCHDFLDGTDELIILDGFTRYEILTELQKERYKLIEYEKVEQNINRVQDAKNYIYKINLRRSLNPYQKAVLALDEYANNNAESVCQNWQSSYGKKINQLKQIELEKKIGLHLLRDVVDLCIRINSGDVPEGFEQKLISGELTVYQAKQIISVAQKVEERVARLGAIPTLKKEMEAKYKDLKYTNKNAFKMLEKELTPQTPEPEITPYYQEVAKISQKINKLEEHFPEKVLIFSVDTSQVQTNYQSNAETILRENILERLLPTKKSYAITVFELEEGA